MKKLTWPVRVELEGGLEFETSVSFVEHSYRWPVSQAVLCPDCGAVWMRVVCKKPAIKNRFEAVNFPCQSCGGGVISFVLKRSYNALCGYRYKVTHEIETHDFMVLSSRVETGPIEAPHQFMKQGLGLYEY